MKIRLFLFIALSVVSSFGANAQIIDNRLGNAFKEEMFFNQEFLWQNKVRTVSMTKSVKRTNRPIESKPDLTVFRFNNVGQLIQIDKVTSILSWVDSLTIEYRRNEAGNLEQKVEKSKQGYFLTQFVYDKEGLLEREDYCRAENVSTEKGKLVPGATTVINSETFKWNRQTETTTSKSTYNNYGLLYSNWTIVRSALGYIQSETEELVISGKTTTKKYSYNDRGWVSAIDYSDNVGGAAKKNTFQYDEVGNLVKIECFNGTRLEEEVEVLYTETMLIEAILTQDMQSKDIVIQKFTYEFH
jgi:hypothetical protein